MNPDGHCHVLVLVLNSVSAPAWGPAGLVGSYDVVSGSQLGFLVIRQ